MKNKQVKHAFAQEADCQEESLEGDILKWVEKNFFVQHLFVFFYIYLGFLKHLFRFFNIYLGFEHLFRLLTFI